MKEHIEGVTVEEAQPYLTKDPELDELLLTEYIAIYVRALGPSDAYSEYRG